LTQELQSQQEELRETNERLEKQAATLRESEERLREQQEALKSTNEKLEDKARQLEVKNREVEIAKSDVEEKADQLAVTSKYKSEFLANMSHELRTPLNSLLILSKMLTENSEQNLTPKQVEYARTIHGAGTDLLGLISDILDLSKIESGTTTVDAGEVNFIDLRDYVEQNFRHVAQQKSLAFEIHLDSRLTQTIVTDAKRLQQVIKNLLSNAFKFTEQGLVKLFFSSAQEGWSRDHPVLSRADTVIAVGVTDTGIGIASEKQRIIFEAFQQADGTTSRKYGGTGLGLSISREIARLLGGELRVSSEVGKGSTFTLYLPRVYTAPAQPLLPQVPQRPASVPPPAGSVDLPPVTYPLASSTIADDRESLAPHDRALLIVDDDPAWAQIVLDSAHAHGFKVIVSATGENAVFLVRKFNPAAITLDLCLPDTDGWRILDSLKHDTNTRHIPVVILSADTDRKRARRMGALDCVEKSPERADLDAMLERVSEFIENPAKQLLIVEDDENERMALVELLSTPHTDVVAVGSGAEALEAIATQVFQCMVLDLGLPDMAGVGLLQKIKSHAQLADLPVLVYTGRALSKKEETELLKLSSSIILKDVQSPERLLEEVALFLHQELQDLSEPQQAKLVEVIKQAPELQGKRVLVVDDDARNIFAVCSALEFHGMLVEYADNGSAAIAMLENASFDSVLMDIMMPELDGYEVIRRIRAQERFSSLPIIALTAKAMRADRDKCLQAGASDYLSKPVEIDKLVAALRVWLTR
jgi:CheY-like chemotaxis protein/signal transduction histidine kinase